MLVLLAACAHDRGPALTDDADAATGAWQAPLGAHWTPAGDAVVFRLAAPHATRVELELYDAPFGGTPTSVAMTLDGDVWTARVPSATYYGYRVWGPNWPYDPAWTPGSMAGWIADVDASGNRMNPNKVVFDPYAEELSHDPTSPAQPDGSAYAVGTHRAVDSGPVAPKGIVVRAGAGDAGPTRPLRDDVIYEVHVRGFTQADAIACAGTYAGAATRAGYLADLGVTAIELMPVQETPNDRNDIDPASDTGDNYWGYATLAYFAPDRRYACDRAPGGPTQEFRAMVAAFHARGIKVLVDVVYNHTAEGSGSALLSMRGVDNAAYYQLDKAGTGFTNDNGVGADLAADKPLAAGIVLDSLAYWHDALGVDGFRFDLAPVLGNDCGPGCFHFAPDGLPTTIAQRARPADGGAGIDLIAEPWAVTANGYALGKFPAGWAQWNDHIRDSLREDQNEAPVAIGELEQRIRGSRDLFTTPTASIDYLVSHDGLTLHDLYACNGANNARGWPYGPSDGGTTANHSWDHGGDAAAQRQAVRTGLALLALSQGVPMITGGDEMLRTIACNNNSYNLDSRATWLDWSLAQTNAPLVTFVQRLFAFRAAHPALHAGTWLDDFATQGTALIWRAGDVLVAYNHAAAATTIALPAGPVWWRAGDTASGLEPDNFSDYMMHQAQYGLAARSLAVFVAR